MPRCTLLFGTAAFLFALVAGSPAAAVTPDASDSLLNQGEKPVRMRLNAEVGALLPAKHSIQLSKAGTRIDYVADGGQDNLFPFLRFSADFRHRMVYPLVALFFGTGNQTPAVSAAVSRWKSRTQRATSSTYRGASLLGLTAPRK